MDSKKSLRFQTSFAANCSNIIYERVGCFTDKQVNDSKLALPEMLVNQTNTIIWDKWNEWLSQFLCRCAEEASKTKYEIFGIHNYGLYLHFYCLPFQNCFPFQNDSICCITDTLLDYINLKTQLN